MSIDDAAPPPLLRAAVADLWRHSIRNEENVLGSAAFKHLKSACTDVYLPIPGSRLLDEPSKTAKPDELHFALCNFFRWNGAPWYGATSSDAGETVLRLHRAFLSSEVSRTFLVPLDRLYLRGNSASGHQRLDNVSFGPNEITRLTRESLIHRIPQDGLKRFGRAYEFPAWELDDRYWLITAEREEAGAIWERNWHSILYKQMDDIGKVPVFNSILPPKIEEAVLVLLLSFIRKPNDVILKPFSIPWIYSYTDDPFAQPRRAPDPSALTWTLIGDPREEFEVSDQSSEIVLGDQEIEALRQTWQKLQAVLATTASGKEVLHPLAVHFFLKAFFEEAIDEIIALISCTEALLRLPGEWTRKNTIARHQNLVSDIESAQWLNDAYDLRNAYLHSKESPNAKITFEDLARARLSVVKALHAYLSFADQNNMRDRTGLLRLLCDR